MAIHVFKGDAEDTAEVHVCTVSGSWSAGEIITATLNGKDFAVTLASTSAASVTVVANAFVAAWNGAAITTDETRDRTGDTIPEMAEMTASNVAGVISITHDTKGIPFSTFSGTSKLTITESGSGVLSAVSVGTKANGPNCFTNENFTNGAPSTGDTIVFENSDVDLLWFLDNLTGADLLGIKCKASYTGNIGLPLKSEHSATSYYEYMPRYLQATMNNSAIIRIGEGEGSGSGRIQIHVEGTGTGHVYDIHATGQSSDQGLHAVRFKAMPATAVVNIHEGSVDFAPESAHVSPGHLGPVNLNMTGGQARDQHGLVASGASLVIDLSGLATFDIVADFQTAHIFGGGTLNVSLVGSTVALIECFDGVVNRLGAGGGTFTNLTCGSLGVFDWTKVAGTDTLSNDIAAEKGASIIDPNAHLLHSSKGIDPGNATMQDINVVSGPGMGAKYA